jgi:hypothetical protein
MRTDVAVEYVFLFVLNKSSYGRVDDAFWLSCCAGAVEDVDWVAWRKRCEYYRI